MVATINFSVKHMFLDRPGIAKRIEKGKIRALKKAGAMVRKRARELLGRKVKTKKDKRKQKKFWQSNYPPRVRSKEPNLKTIYFIYDGQKMIVGPVKFAGSGDGVPGVHEHGKTGTVVVKGSFGETKRKKRPKFKINKHGVKVANQPSQMTPIQRQRMMDRLRSEKQERQKRTIKFTVKFKKRPFMAPALQSKKKEFPALFRNLIK